MKSKAFTLIELAIVMCIVGILTCIAVPKFVDLIEQSKAEDLGMTWEQWYIQEHGEEKAIVKFGVEKIKPNDPEVKKAVEKVRIDKSFTYEEHIAMSNECLRKSRGASGEYMSGWADLSKAHAIAAKELREYEIKTLYELCEEDEALWKMREEETQKRKAVERNTTRLSFE